MADLSAQRGLSPLDLGPVVYAVGASPTHPCPFSSSPPPQRVSSFYTRHPLDVGLTDIVPLTPFQLSQQTTKALALVGSDGGQALAMVRGLITSQHQGD